MALAPRAIYKNISAVSFNGGTVWGIKGFDVNVDAEFDTDIADNELNAQPYGIQNIVGTLTFEAGDLNDVVRVFSVGNSGSVRGSYVAKRGTAATVVIASAWCQNIAMSGVAGDTAGVTVTWGFQAGSLSHS